MKLNALLDVDVVAVETEDRISILLELAAPARDGDRSRAPGTLQVVLDRSGSMAGAPLAAACRALESLVTRLDPADHFGLVAFDDAVRVVVPAQPLAAKEAVKQAIRRIDAGGMTNLSGGYLRGIQEVRRVADGRGATLLLVSDGHANVGIVEPDKLACAARSAHAHGIATSTIGLGLGYDEHLLAAIARGGTGNHRFAEDADAGAAALAAEVDELLDQVVQAATLTIAPTGDVDSVVLYNELPAAAVDGAVVVELGDFYAGEQRKLLIALGVPTMPALGLATVARLTLRWVDVDTLAAQTVTVPVNVNVVPGDEAAGRVPNPAVRTERAFQDAQRAKRLAAEALRGGDVGRAGGLLGDAELGLRAAMAAAPGRQLPELADEAELLREMGVRAHDEAAVLSKEVEMDSYYKSVKRGRRRG